jgi:hypothetical protein
VSFSGYDWTPGAAQFLDPALKEYGWIQGRIPPDAWMLRG